MAQAHAGGFPERLYDEHVGEGFIRRHWRTATAISSVLVAAGTIGFITSDRNRPMTGEEVNRALNSVPAQTQMAQVAESPSTDTPAYVSTPSSKAKTSEKGLPTPLPGGVQVEVVGRDPATLKKYFGLTEDYLRSRGITKYEFNIATFGIYEDGTASMTISLNVFDNDGWHATEPSRKPYFGK
jgi:hypothetical protein